MSKHKKQIRENFRVVCLKRDKSCCKICTYKPSPDLLDVHHITDRNEMPNGGYVKENGITLCEECHKKAEVFHSSGKENSIDGYHPNDLYLIIESSHEDALNASLRLK